MSEKEKFLAELKNGSYDPWVVIEALVNAVDPEDGFVVEDLYEILYEGGFEFSDEVSE